jgi:hypothetical protein
MTNPEAHPPGPEEPHRPSGTPLSASGIKGMIEDAPTLAATGLIAAVAFATVAGLFGFLVDPGSEGFRGRLLNLTDTVDVGDVALLGLAAALLLLTVDPPGGIPRSILLAATAGLAAIITGYGLVRALVLISERGAALIRLDQFIATLGVAIAAATVAYYAARESFLKHAAA